MDNIESVEQLMALLEPKENESAPSLDNLAVLNFQIFLKFFSKYACLPDNRRKDFHDAYDVFVENSHPMLCQSAFGAMMEIILAEDKSKVKIVAGKEESSTPCEDCLQTPTHLVEFKKENRSEKHFLCEECEKGAKKIQEASNE